MGPTNIALVNLYKADQQLREAQGRLDAVTRGVRIQERKVRDLAEKLQAAQSSLKEQQVQSSNLELDLTMRDAHIEKLRSQQQNTKNNKEYQNFLIQINTEKVDRNKVEEQVIKAMEQVEKVQAEVSTLLTLVDAEKAKLGAMQQEIGEKAAVAQAEIDQLKPRRDEAAAAVPAKARDGFERMAERYEGEAMAAIGKPNPKREEYICGGCHMSLVVDVYNRLKVRNDPVACPSCQRYLYIPDDLPPELAINSKRTVAKVAEE